MNRSIHILASAAAMIFAALPAHADETRSTAVVASSADFATPAARSALDRRIQTAVEDVCGANAVAEGISWGAIKQCRAQLRHDIYSKLAPLNEMNGERLSAR